MEPQPRRPTSDCTWEKGAICTVPAHKKVETASESMFYRTGGIWSVKDTIGSYGVLAGLLTVISLGRNQSENPKINLDKVIANR